MLLIKVLLEFCLIFLLVLVLSTLLFFRLKRKDTRSSSIAGTFLCKAFVTLSSLCSLVDVKEDFI